MTPDDARDVIASESQLLGYWELQRRGRDEPDRKEITLAQVEASISALLDAAKHVPQSEAEDVRRLVEVTHTRIKLKYGIGG